MNNVKILQRGYSENKVFSACRRLRMKMEINILGEENNNNNNNNVSFYKYTLI